MANISIPIERIRSGSHRKRAQAPIFLPIWFEMLADLLSDGWKTKHSGISPSAVRQQMDIRKVQRRIQAQFRGRVRHAVSST